MPVFSSVIVTSALGTGAPCGSLTVPVILISGNFATSFLTIILGGFPEH
jgi:hypothetical protein